MTHLSHDRLYQLESQCRAWPGPISAIVYLPLAPDKATKDEMKRRGIQPGKPSKPSSKAAEAEKKYTTGQGSETAAAVASGLSMDSFFSTALAQKVRCDACCAPPGQSFGNVLE